MGRRHKYEQTVKEEERAAIDDRPEHRLHLENCRAYLPSEGQEESGVEGGMAANAIGGDWSWKPWRDKQVGENFRTFLGVPRGAAEMYGPRILS